MPLIQIQGEQDVAINDAKQYTGNGGGMVPEGIYQVLVTGFDLNPPKEAGKYPWSRLEGQVVAVLQLADPQSVPPMGRTVSEVLSHSPKTVGTMKALVEAAGVRFEIVQYSGGVQGLSFDTDHLVNRIIEVKVIHQADDRPGAKYPLQTRLVDYQPQGTFARAGGVVQSARPGAVPGVTAQPVAAQPFVPGGYQHQQVAPQPLNQPVAQPVHQQVAHQPVPAGYGQQVPQGYQGAGAPPPAYQR